MRIVLTGGGTGGHLFPLVAVSQSLRSKLGSDCELMYIGSGLKIEEEVMNQQGIPIKKVMSGKIRRYFSLKNFIDVFKVPIGIIQALWILLRYMPDAVFSKGGFAAVPVVIAAWIYRIPVMIHESDAVPGLANKICAKFALRIAIAYPSAKDYFPEDTTALVGNPVRDEIYQGDAPSARNLFHLTESKPTIFVLGGSQGSRAINEALVRILPNLLMRAQVIHQTGEQNYEDVLHLAAEFGIKAGREGYMPYPFLNSEQMKHAYAVSELVISRAGANSIAEIAANKKPAILIPLSGAANDHQRINAFSLAEINASIVLEESNLGENLLMDKIESILGSEELKQTLSGNIKSFHHEQATEVIANGIIEMVR